MGQKVHPTSLRLHPQNKHFDSCWFNDKRYADSVSKELSTETYYNAILKQIEYPSASCFFSASPRKCQISFFFHNPRECREKYFRQPAQLNKRNRKRRPGKGHAWGMHFYKTTKKKTTSLQGLLEEDRGFLGLLGPSFPPLSFLEDLKLEKNQIPQKNLHLPSSQRGFPLKNKKSLFLSVYPRIETLLQSQFLKKKDLLQFSHFSEKKKRTPLFQTSQRFNPFQLKGQKKTLFTRNSLGLNVCSGQLGLAISHYFMERKLSGNLLSATSRFLLLLPPIPFWIEKRKERDTGSYSLDSVSGGFSQQKRKHSHDVGNQIFSPDKKNSLSSDRKETPSAFLEECRGTFLQHLQKSSLYNYHIESIISERAKSSCKIFLFRAQNVAQSALFICEEIVYQLQRRTRFRQIQTRFLQDLRNKSAIKGVRVTCVGRIGGRAKKAQRARGESFKMGQTSLHFFDSRLSFASKTALTPYGTVGVKVWVCWE